MRSCLAFLFACFVLQQITVAQLPATYQIHYYDSENGLPSNGTKGMQWDEQTGFLWLGTEAGLVRFNGIEFKVFSKENTPIIGATRIRILSRNSKGLIYAVDDLENFLYIDHNKIVLGRKSTLPEKDITSAFYTFAISDTFFNYKINHLDVEPHLNSYLKKGFAITDTSMLGIIDGNAVIFSFHSQKTIPFVPKAQIFKTGFRIGDNIFLVTNDNAVFKVDLDEKSLIRTQLGQTGAFTKEFKNKDFIFFWDPGLQKPILINRSKAWEIDYDGAILTTKKICDVVPENIPIRTVQYSPTKELLFLGTISKGLIVISKNKVAVIRKEHGDTVFSNAYVSQLALPNDNILTDNGDIFGSQKVADTPIPIKGSFGYDVYTMNDSLLWFSQPETKTLAPLCRYNYATGITTRYDKIPVGDNFAISQSNGKIYIATQNGFGILKHDCVEYLYRTGLRTGFTPYSIAEISPGVFVIAFCSQLIRFNTNSQVADTLMALPGNCIRTLWKYNDYLFIGTYGSGFYIFKNGKLKAMPLDKNKYLLYTHCFVTDKYGFCWMSSNHGLFKARLDDLIRAFENNSTEIYYQYHGRENGMETTEMNGGCTPCALQMNNGIISFPTMDGLLWVDPGVNAEPPSRTDFFIDDILVNNKKLSADSLQSESLPSGTKVIRIQLGFSGWDNKENVYLEYKLNNSGDWNQINDAEFGVFELSPGNYDLQIRKLNGFGIDNYSYKELHFSISTPWYRQWWAYVLFTLAVIALGRIFFKLRTRQYTLQQRKLEQQVFEKTKELQVKNEILEKNNTIKTRLISIISHDIITPLKFLSVTGKNLREKKQLMSEELQEDAISEIVNTSQDLQLLSTNIMNWIKYQNENRRLAKDNFNVHELVDRVTAVLHSFAKQKQVNIVNETEDLLINQFAEPLSVIVYNLVSNAINSSETGNIIINSYHELDHVIISVKDEGVGMTAEQVQNILSEEVIISTAKTDYRKGNGLGYLIIRDLVKMIGAELSIESEKRKGTTVYVRIPV